MNEVRCYWERAKGYEAERVEIWSDSGVPDIYVFPFETIAELRNFQKWLDATIAMITGRDEDESKRNRPKAARVARRTDADRSVDGTS